VVLALALGWVSLPVPAQVVGYGGSNRLLAFHSQPPGASVRLGTSYLGRADDGHPVVIQVQNGGERTMFTFQLTLDGYQPRDVKVSSVDLTPTSVYQVPAVELIPASVAVWLRDLVWTHAAVLASLVVLGVALVVWYVRSRRAAHLEQKEMARQAQMVEVLTSSTGESTVASLMGRRLGQFLVVEEIGRGGMATVYKALPADSMNDSEAVAIKVIKEDHLADVESRARFEREVRIGAKLNHPNIVRLLDWGATGPYYLVMELVREEGMSPSEALHLMRPVFEAMAYAHDLGVWHRDLKPENIFVGNRDGRLTVMDFGISRQATDATVTSTDQMPVTPGYMSPEQFSAKNVAAASDQYSLGVMVWELIAGHRPFEDPSPLVVVLKHVQSPLPSLRAECPQVSGAFEAALNRMMAKNVSDRYSNLQEAYAALEHAAMPRMQ
jgi:tRNA A-37 threonylcarbamoyl transferase component Bud32